MAKHGCEPNKMLDRTAECFITQYVLSTQYAFITITKKSRYTGFNLCG